MNSSCFVKPYQGFILVRRLNRLSIL